MKKDAIKELFQDASIINQSLTHQLMMFPQITKNIENIKIAILKLKEEREMLPHRREKLKDQIPSNHGSAEIDNNFQFVTELDRIIDEARRGMCDPVISEFHEPAAYRKTKHIDFGWNIFDATYWYYAKHYPGERDLGNTYHPPYFFHPKSTGVQFWNSVYNFFVVAVAFIIPYDLGAAVPEHWLWLISLLSTGVTIADLFIRSRTALETFDGLITDPAFVIGYQFSSGKLLADLFIGFPWILLLKISDFHVIMLLHLVCVLRLLDNRDILIFFSGRKIAARYGVSIVFVKLLEVYGCQLIFWHWAACANIRFGIKSKMLSPFDVYTDHFERISSRQHDYRDLTPFQNFMNVIFIIVGCIFSVMFLTILESYLTDLNGAGSNFEDRINELNHYCDYKGFGLHFREKMLHHYDHKYPGGQYCKYI
jgi:hypothetical protein